MQLLLVFCLTVIAKTEIDFSADCNFAHSYDLNTLFELPSEQDEFLHKVVYWEGKFLRESVNLDTGMANFDMTLDFESGAGVDFYHDTEPQLEGLHLAFLALALDGNEFAIALISSSMHDIDNISVEDFVLDQLTKKIDSFERFHLRFPGFGGYFTRSHNSEGEIWPNDPQIDSKLNGNFMWGLVAVVEALNRSGHTKLQTRYANRLKMMADNAMTLFMRRVEDLGDMSDFLLRIHVQNTSLEPSYENYVPESKKFMDEPWDEEYPLYFLYLYANWSSIENGDAIKDSIWELKSKNTVALDFESTEGAITLLAGYQNHLFDKLKYLFLPYFDVDLAERVFLNGEKARVHISAMNNIPGLPNYPNLPSTHGGGDDSLASPMNTAALLMHPQSRAFGIVWLATMLKGDKMQGPLGHTYMINYADGKRAY